MKISLTPKHKLFFVTLFLFSIFSIYLAFFLSNNRISHRNEKLAEIPSLIINDRTRSFEDFILSSKERSTHEFKNYVYDNFTWVELIDLNQTYNKENFLINKTHQSFLEIEGLDSNLTNLIFTELIEVSKNLGTQIIYGSSILSDKKKEYLPFVTRLSFGDTKYNVFGWFSLDKITDYVNSEIHNMGFSISLTTINDFSSAKNKNTDETYLFDQKIYQKLNFFKNYSLSVNYFEILITLLLNMIIWTFSILLLREQQRNLVLQKQINLNLSNFSSQNNISIYSEITKTIAHELNQPLFAIEAITSSCLKKIKDSKYDKTETITLLKDIKKIVNRCSRIIKNLRSSDLVGHPEKQALNVKKVIYGLDALIKSRCEKNQISILYDISNSHNILCSLTDFEQIILNLVYNSIDSFEENSGIEKKIIIASKPKKNDNEGLFTICISDNGKGILLSDPNKIFSPYYSTKKKGMGLGLSISRRLIERNNGKIEIISLKSPTTFEIDFPVTESENQ